MDVFFSELYSINILLHYPKRQLDTLKNEFKIKQNKQKTSSKKKCEQIGFQIFAYKTFSAD